MMRVFDWSWMVLVAVIAGAGVAGLVVSGYHRRMARLGRLGARDLVRRLVPQAAFTRPSWRAARLGGAALLALLALAGPRWGVQRELTRGEGIDMVIALDASLSMMATDVQPNRLERMKQEVRRLLAQSPGDRVSLLAFAGRSYILTPLTVDEGAIDLFLDNLDPSIVGEAGSALSTTIVQATDLLQATRTTSDRAIVVLSDGEAFEEEQAITSAASRAGEAGVSLVTVGFGTTEGSTIPIREGGQVVSKRDENGEVVITRYHPELLEAAARAANGTFIDAASTDKASKIRAALQNLRTTSRTVEGRRSEVPRFQLFLLPALILVLLDLWRSERRGSRRLAPAAATTAAIGALVSSCALPPNVVSQAAAEYRGGHYAAAARLYRRAVERGDRRPAVMYDFGTALVAADSFASAVEPLERVAKTEAPELRFRSLFNLGLAHLERGLAGAPDADSTKQELDGALDAYKRALLMRPGDMDAKWNYELALRRKHAGGGGGGGDSQSRSGGGASPEPSQAERPSGALGEQQAEQLLNSAAREERSVQSRKQHESKPQTPPGRKDW